MLKFETLNNSSQWEVGKGSSTDSLPDLLQTSHQLALLEVLNLLMVDEMLSHNANNLRARVLTA